MTIKNHTELMNYIRESINSEKTDTNKGVELTLDGLLYDDLQDAIQACIFDDELKQYNYSYTYNETYKNYETITQVVLRIQWRE